MTQRGNHHQLMTRILMASVAVAVVCLLIPMSAVAADDTAKAEQDRVKAAGDALDELVTKENGIHKSPQQVRMRHHFAFGEESWFHHSRPIWPRTDELPERRKV